MFLFFSYDLFEDGLALIDDKVFLTWAHRQLIVIKGNSFFFIQPYLSFAGSNFYGALSPFLRASRRETPGNLWSLLNPERKFENTSSKINFF